MMSLVHPASRRLSGDFDEIAGEYPTLRGNRWLRHRQQTRRRRSCPGRARGTPAGRPELRIFPRRALLPRGRAAPGVRVRGLPTNDRGPGGAAPGDRRRVAPDDPRDPGPRARGARRDRRADDAGAGRRAVRPEAGGAGEPRRGSLPRGWLDLLDGRARPALVNPWRLRRDPADPDEESAALAPLWRDRRRRPRDEGDDALLR